MASLITLPATTTVRRWGKNREIEDTPHEDHPLVRDNYGERSVGLSSCTTPTTLLGTMGIRVRVAALSFRLVRLKMEAKFRSRAARERGEPVVSP